MNLTVGDCVKLGEWGEVGEGGRGEGRGRGEVRCGVTGGEKASGRSAAETPSVEETLESRLVCVCVCVRERGREREREREREHVRHSGQDKRCPDDITGCPATHVLV